MVVLWKVGGNDSLPLLNRWDAGQVEVSRTLIIYARALRKITTVHEFERIREAVARVDSVVRKKKEK